VNDRYFDLACVCVEFGLDEQMQEVWLEAYFMYDDFNFEKLEAYKMMYKALCEEWFENNP
jgi:thiamine kinase-like enzyme